MTSPTRSHPLRLATLTALAASTLAISACGGASSAGPSAECFWRVEITGEVQLEAGREGRGFPGAYGFYEDDGAARLTLSSLSQASTIGFWLDMSVEQGPRPGETGAYLLEFVNLRLMEGMNPADAEYALESEGAAQLVVRERTADWLAAEFEIPLVREDAGEPGPHAVIAGGFRTPLGKTRCPK